MNKTYSIGVHISNTQTTIGVVNAEGIISNKNSINADYHNITEHIDLLHHHLSDLIKELGGSNIITGIGIASYNSNYFTGCLDCSPDHKCEGSVPIAQILSDKLQLPITLINNANAAALGEMAYGVALELNDFILYSLDNDVSKGTVVKGDIVIGHNLFSGKSGHTNLHNNLGRVCKCGRKDCLEAYCSTDGIVTTTLELLSTSAESSILRETPQQELTFEHIYNALTQDDKIAQEAYLFTAHMLGQVLSDLMAYSSPKAFILSGKVAENNDFFVQATRKSFESDLLKVYEGKTEIITSKLDYLESIILGASLSATKSILVEI